MPWDGALKQMELPAAADGDRPAVQCDGRAAAEQGFSGLGRQEAGAGGQGRAVRRRYKLQKT
jgi:hypothetical protein